MSIYSGNNQSPFSGGGVVRAAKRKPSRASKARRNSERASNEISRVANIDVTTVKGNSVVTTGLSNSGEGLIKNANSLAMTSSSGLNVYDGLDIIANGGNPVLYMSCTVGTDFPVDGTANAEFAWSDKKDVKITWNIRDLGTFNGFLDRDSFFRWTYKIVFPTIANMNYVATADGDPNTLTIQYRTG